MLATWGGYDRISATRLLLFDSKDFLGVELEAKLLRI